MQGSYGHVTKSEKDENMQMWTWETFLAKEQAKKFLSIGEYQVIVEKDTIFPATTCLTINRQERYQVPLDMETCVKCKCALHLRIRIHQGIKIELSSV